MTVATPAKAPYPAANFLAPTIEELSASGIASAELATTAPCCLPVQVGLFFDGTNNNMERDLRGRRVGLVLGGKRQDLPNRRLRPEQCSHTNIVRLHNAFPGSKQGSGYFRYYMPGVGTEFPEIGEPCESWKGKAFAKGGQPRIIWALLQVLNAVHGAVLSGPLYQDDEAGKLAQNYDSEVGRQTENGDSRQSVLTHSQWFEPHIEKLKRALATKPKPKITALRLSVFGFSRGGAEAAAFCHFFNDLLEGGKLIGIPVDIGFLGLFDVVASVGLSHSVSETTLVPERWADGHLSWAARILDPLPPIVKNGRHYMASHEMRMNFPLTVMQGPIEEIYFPGVHSDVGGGYAPGEQGKGRGSQAALLSQIPLAHMYKAARLAGVPLRPFSELEARDKIDFEVDAGLASAWEAYTAEFARKDESKGRGMSPGGAGTDKSTLLKPHMALYYRWRAARLTTLESTASFTAAGTQDQQDMRDANRMLAGDLEALTVRQKAPPTHSGRDDTKPFSASDQARINQWQYQRAQNGQSLEEWETWAREVFNQAEPLPPNVMRFFDDYVHDSFAGFYLAGEASEYDRRVKVAEVMRKDPARLRGFDKKIYETTTQVKAAQDKKAAGKPLTQDEEGLINEAETGTPYPVMTDEDTSDMRSAAIRTQTETRREGGGYLYRRSCFPHHGFLFWRRSIRQEQLDRVASNFKWSDDPRGDIALASSEGASLAA